MLGLLLDGAKEADDGRALCVDEGRALCVDATVDPMDLRAEALSVCWSSLRISAISDFFFPLGSVCIGDQHEVMNPHHEQRGGVDIQQWQ